MSIAAPLAKALVGYVSYKHEFEQWSKCGDNLLHVHAGLVIFALALLISRKKVSSPLPISAVIVFAVLNELADLTVGGWASDDFSFIDIANSVFWPAVLFIIARWITKGSSARR